MHYFLMVMRDTSAWLVGPFVSQAVAARWGYSAYSPDDDPRWQTIWLANPAEPLPLISPDWPLPAAITPFRPGGLSR